MRDAMLPGRDPETANAFRRQLDALFARREPDAFMPPRNPEMAGAFRQSVDDLFAPRDPAREYGAILPISSNPNVPGSGQFDPKGGFIGELLGLLGAGGRAMRGEAYDPMAITSGMMNVAAPSVASRAKGGVLRSAGAGSEPTEINAMVPSIRAYHGSPHTFDRFDAAHIGSGEGAQAFGRGLYFAENENVARGYRDALAPLGPGAAAGLGPQGIASRLLEAGVSEKDAIAELNRRLQAPHVLRGLANRDPKTMAWASTIAEAKKILENPNSRGRVYEVNIRADPNKFLDWDEIGASNFRPPEALKNLVTQRIQTQYGPKFNYDNVNDVVKRYLTEAVLKTPEALSALRDAGVPGIRYFDAGSRNQGEGTRNYVVFDDKLIDIVRRYGIAGLTMGGVAAAAGGAQANPVD